MTIASPGRIKFLDSNYLDSNTSYTFTSANTALAKFLYDRKTNTKLQSSGSDDLTPEVWIFDYGADKDIDRLLITNHNIKAGKIEYWNGAAYVDFSAAIAWSGNSTTQNYYEFTSVSTDKIRLTMDTTIAVDAEKSVGGFYAFEEIGMLTTNPTKSDPIFNESSKVYETSNAGNVYVFFGSKFKVVLKFKKAYTTDMTLIRTLKDRGKPFFVYLCGGQADLVEEGYRIQDIYLVNYVKDFKYKLVNALHNVGVKIDIDLREV